MVNCQEGHTRSPFPALSLLLPLSPPHLYRSPPALLSPTLSPISSLPYPSLALSTPQIQLGDLGSAVNSPSGSASGQTHAFWCKAGQNWAYSTVLRAFKNWVNIFSKLRNLQCGKRSDPKSETAVYRTVIAKVFC